MALTLAGVQFTHAGELHAGLGHLGHQYNISVDVDMNDRVHDRGDNHAVADQSDHDALETEGGLHCGVPLMATFSHIVLTMRLPAKIVTITLGKRLLTTRFNLDPPPPRA